MGTFTDDQPLPNAALLLGLVVVFLILSFVTHLQQYYTTYGLVYNEVKSTRLSLAERLRKLPLGYFGKRDLADLTETIMGDVNRMEHVWSHAVSYTHLDVYKRQVRGIQQCQPVLRRLPAAVWYVADRVSKNV